MYEPATEPDGEHRRWLREAPDHRCCLRGLVCCLRHGQPPTPPKQGARDDWWRTPDRPHTHHAEKQACAFRLRNREAKRELNVVWNGPRLSNTTTPVFWASTLTELCAIKRTSRTQRWRWTREITSSVNPRTRSGGCKASTLRLICLAFCYQLPNTPALCGQGLHTRTSWTRPYTTAAESSRAASNQRTWTVYTYRPVSPLLASGGQLPAAWNAPDKRQSPDTNCSITNQLLADWRRGRGAHSHAARLICKQQQTAALERQPDRRASLRQNGTGGGRVFAGWIWRGLALLTSP